MSSLKLVEHSTRTKSVEPLKLCSFVLRILKSSTVCAGLFDHCRILRCNSEQISAALPSHRRQPSPRHAGHDGCQLVRLHRHGTSCLQGLVGNTKTSA